MVAVSGQWEKSRPPTKALMVVLDLLATWVLLRQLELMVEAVVVEANQVFITA